MNSTNFFNNIGPKRLNSKIVSELIAIGSILRIGRTIFGCFTLFWLIIVPIVLLVTKPFRLIYSFLKTQKLLPKAVEHTINEINKFLLKNEPLMFLYQLSCLQYVIGLFNDISRLFNDNN